MTILGKLTLVGLAGLVAGCVLVPRKPQPVEVVHVVPALEHPVGPVVATEGHVGTAYVLDRGVPVPVRPQ
jgi:hypothetical protein